MALRCSSCLISLAFKISSILSGVNSRNSASLIAPRSSSSRIKPDAVAVEAHVDANAARILSIHEAATVGTDERAVRIEAEVLREQFVQTGTSGEGPDLLLVEKESVARGADVHLHRAMMGAPRLLA